MLHGLVHVRLMIRGLNHKIQTKSYSHHAKPSSL